MIATAALLSSVVSPFSTKASAAAPTSVAANAVSAPTADSAPDSISAQLLARTSGKRIEVTSERTETATTWANPEGTFTTDESAGPIRIADDAQPSGWRELDYELVKQEDGSVGPKSGYVPLALSGKASAEEAQKNGIIRAIGDRDQSIAFGWNDALPEPELDGHTATYKDVQDNVDLVVELTATGFEQYFVLTERPAGTDPLTLSFPLVAPGLTIQEKIDGDIELSDSKNRLIGTIPSPFMWDSNESNGSGISENHAELDMEIVTDGDGSRNIELSPDPDYLNDPATTYPVVIDPAVNLSPSFDTFVRSDFPTTDYGSHAELQVGTYNGGTTKARSYIGFSKSAWNGKDVTAATLKLYLFHSWSCTAASFSTYVSNAPSASTRWASQPALVTAQAKAVSTAKGYNSSCAAGYVSVPVTAMADYQAASGGVTVAYGLRASETANAGWKRFNSANATANKPVLSVTYNGYPSAPPAPTLLPAAIVNGDSTIYTSSTTPTFTSRTTDPEGVSSAVKFEVHSGVPGTGTLVAECTTAAGGSGAAASCAIATPLSDNATYQVRARGFDGTIWSKEWSPATVFSVSAGAPPAATFTCPSPHTDGHWADSVPSTAVQCTAQVAGSSASTAAVSLGVTVDGTDIGSIAFAGALGGSKSFSIPATSGPHSVKATTTSRTGAIKNATFSLGFGSAGIISPISDTKTTDSVKISAIAPPRGSATVMGVLKWRPADSSSTDWTTAPWQIPLAQSAATAPVSVDGAIWSSLEAVSYMTGGTSVTLNPRRPLLLEIQLCFLYVPGGTQCTADEAQPLTVLRIPHAFDSEYPVANAGDGSVALWTGEFSLSHTDANISTAADTISVARTHSTLAGPGNSVTDAFGPGWVASFGAGAGASGHQVIDNTPVDGTITLMASDGTSAVFRHEDRATGATPQGNYVAVGEETENLEAQLEVIDRQTDPKLLFTESDGTQTTWSAQDPSSIPIVWIPESVEQIADLGSNRYSADARGRITRILAATPGQTEFELGEEDEQEEPQPDLYAIDCSGTNLVPGCSAVHLIWEDSAGGDCSAADASCRVKRIDYETFNSEGASPGMDREAILSYSYNSDGRLTMVADLLQGTDTVYDYDLIGQSVVISDVKRSGSAEMHYNYSLVAGLPKLKNVTVDSAVSGGQESVQSSYVYDVPPSTSGLPSVSHSQIAKWGQTRVPTSGFAVFDASHPVASSSPGSIQPNDWEHASLYFSDEDGYTVNSAVYGAGQWLLNSDEIDANGKFVRSLGPDEIVDAIETSANGGTYIADATQPVSRFNADVSVSSQTEPLVNAGSYILDEWTAPFWVESAAGGPIYVRTHTSYKYDQGAPHSGINPQTSQPYLLPTEVTVGVSAAQNTSTDPAAIMQADMEIISSTKYGYSPIAGGIANQGVSGWTLGSPTSTTISVDGGDGDILTTTRYNKYGGVVETSEPSSGGSSAGSTITTYFTAAPNVELPGCGLKPAWAGLVCQTAPSANASVGSDGTTKTSLGYNKWMSPLGTVETSGAASRTRTTSYHSDGRVATSSTAVAGLTGSTPIARTRAVYDTVSNKLIGLESLSSTGAVDQEVSWEFDRWGRQTTYVNSFGELSTTSYVPPGVAGAGNVQSVVDLSGTIQFSYDGLDANNAIEHRGYPTAMVLSGIGSVSTAYDRDGSLVRQELPGGIVQDLAYAADGQVESQTYSGEVQEDGAPVHDIWMSFSRSFDGGGRTIREWTPEGGTSLVDESYAKSYKYDLAGRVSEASTMTRASSSADLCTVQDYTYSAQGNRIASKVATAEDDCPATGGVTTTFAYDELSRQISGANGAGSYVYDEFGRQLSVPASDAPTGGATMAIEYFDSDAVRSLTQNSVKTEFGLDAASRRVSEAVTDNGLSVSNRTLHYSSPSDSPAWIDEGASRTTFRDGLLGALQFVRAESGSQVVARVLLSDLSGSIVSSATIPTTGNSHEVTAFAQYDLFGGVPQGSSGVSQSGGYGWKGESKRSTHSSGIILMGARLYNSTTGRFTSADPVVGGNENSYNYPNDPTVSDDLTGMKTKITTGPWKVKYNQFRKGINGCVGSGGAKIETRNYTITTIAGRASRVQKTYQYKANFKLTSCGVNKLIIIAGFTGIFTAAIGALAGGIAGLNGGPIASLLLGIAGSVAGTIGPAVGAGWVSWCNAAGRGVSIFLPPTMAAGIPGFPSCKGQ